MARGSQGIRRLTEYLDEARDAFGKPISNGTRNAVDVPSFYRFNDERLRFVLNGARTDPTTVPTKFEDLQGSYRHTPDAGDLVEIHTAERPRYVVGYESAASMAAKGDTALGTGDQFRCGVRDRSSPENMAYFEVNGDAPNRLVLEGGGVEVASQEWDYPTHEDFEVTYQTPVRYEIQFNWYNVGRYKFSVAYTNSNNDDGDKQVLKTVGELTVDDDFGTGDAAFHLFHELDAATSGQELRTGSYAFITLGDVTPTTRTKGSRLTGLSYSGTGDYEPLAAAQIDPARGNVYAQIKNLNVFPDGGSGEMLTIVVRDDQTDATGFATPPEHSPNNSVVEETTDITTFPDQAGNVVTSAADPNGYQTGLSTFESSGAGSNTRIQPSPTVENKRPLYEDDIAIFLYKADTASARSVNVTYYVEQDY